MAAFVPDEGSPSWFAPPVSKSPPFGLDLPRPHARGHEPGPGEVRSPPAGGEPNRRDLLLVEGIYNPEADVAGRSPSDGAASSRRLVRVTWVAPGDRVALHFFTGWISGEPPNTEKLDRASVVLGGDGTPPPT